MQSFEQLIETKQFEQAYSALFQKLNQLEIGADYSHDYLINRIDPDITQQYSQLAKHLTELFKSKAEISLGLFFGLTLHKHKINAIFEISEFNNTDHLLTPLITKFNRVKNKKDQQATTLLMKILLLYHFSNTIKNDIWYFLAINPELGIETVIALLSKRSVLRRAEEQNYIKFISQIDTIKQWHIHDHSPAVLGQAWFQAAYDFGDHKFKILSALNYILKKWLDKHNINIQNSHQAASSRPKCLVVLEHFRSNHAMYRCFANGIKALREKYHLIALTQAEDLDETSRKLFDEVITVELKVPLDIANVVTQIKKLQIDLCYFTSVGMRYWTVALANLRLAPIQYVTAGHPISTCSDAIDFMLLEDHKFDSKIHFQEQVLGLPSGTFGFVLPDYKRPTKKQDNKKLKIAIPASVYKLNPTYLEVCEMIKNQCKLELEFHSFSGCRGIEYHQLNTKLQTSFDDIQVYPAIEYDDYLEKLSQCDLYLAPFPFGGTNSTIDCLLLGIPCVALDYPDLACADPFILRHVDLNYCVAKDVNEYIKIALELLNDPEKRSTLHQQITKLDANLNGLLGTKSSGTAYADAIEYSHRDFSTLKRSGQVFISSTELDSYHKLR